MSHQVKILVAVPGAGKTTYIKTHFPGAIVCSADQYFEKTGQYIFDSTKLYNAHKASQNRFNDALEAGAKMLDDAPVIVVDNTNLRLRDIRAYLEPAVEAGYDVELIILKVDPAVATKRGLHGVPADKVLQMHKQFTDLLKMLPEQWNKIVVDND